MEEIIQGAIIGFVVTLALLAFCLVVLLVTRLVSRRSAGPVVERFYTGGYHPGVPLVEHEYTPAEVVNAKGSEEMFAEMQEENSA